MNFRQVFGAGLGSQIFGRFPPTPRYWWDMFCEANPTMVLTALQSESQVQFQDFHWMPWMPGFFEAFLGEF